MDSKPSDMMLLVITQWFVNLELLAHEIALQQAAVQSSNKWLYNFKSASNVSSLVLQHDGFCRNSLLNVVDGQYEKKKL